MSLDRLRIRRHHARSSLPHSWVEHYNSSSSSLKGMSHASPSKTFPQPRKMSLALSPSVRHGSDPNSGKPIIGGLKARADDSETTKRSSTSRHGLLKLQTQNWLAKEAEIRTEMNVILAEKSRIDLGRREALWKSWVYHVASPLAITVQMHLQKNCAYDMWWRKREMLQDYLDFCNNRRNVVSLDRYDPKVYNPFSYKAHPCEQLVTPRLHDPLMMKWRDRDQEKHFVQSEWPFTATVKHDGKKQSVAFSTISS